MKITRKIKDAGALLELSVLDHKIVAHDACYSFADVFYSNLFRG
jgi:DNA repair protein RadC